MVHLVGIDSKICRYSMFKVCTRPKQINIIYTILENANSWQSSFKKTLPHWATVAWADALMPSEADLEQMEHLQAWNVSMPYNGKALMITFNWACRHTNKWMLRAAEESSLLIERLGIHQPKWLGKPNVQQLTTLTVVLITGIIQTRGVSSLKYTYD